MTFFVADFAVIVSIMFNEAGWVGLAYQNERAASLLSDGAAERCVKKAALARRNFLFVQGEAGGESAAIALTLIETAAANRVEPMGYLRWGLQKGPPPRPTPIRFCLGRTRSRKSLGSDFSPQEFACRAQENSCFNFTRIKKSPILSDT